MAQLGKFQMAAVKRMAKSIKPLENKMERLEQNKRDYIEQKDAEIAILSQQIESIHSAIETFTGGMSLTEILNPEAVPTDMEVDDLQVDEEERPEEYDVTEAMQALQIEEPIAEVQEEVVSTTANAFFAMGN